MIRQIQQALKNLVFSFSSHRSQQESMMKMDFKIGDERTNFMQLCFSNLASWPLFVLLLIIYFDPTRYSWSLQQAFSNSPQLSFFLLDGRMQNILIFLFAFFLIEWIFRFDYLFIGLVFYFLHKSDIHINLALAAVVGIHFSKTCHMWWLHVDLKSRTREIWKTLCTLQMVGCVAACLIMFSTLEKLRSLGYFSESMTVNRFEFLTLALFVIYLIQFILSTLWGHFKFKEKQEPTDFITSYSTATWILRIKISASFKKTLKAQVEKYTTLHQENLNELATLKDLGPVSIPSQIRQILVAELEFLKLASSRLTIE